MTSVENILPLTKAIEKKYNVDLAIPNCPGSGIGNILSYTRLVEEFALKRGKTLKIFTGPLSPSIGKVEGENCFAVWENNPFISEIVNGEDLNSQDLMIVNKERHSLNQLTHVIENICWAYGISPRELRPSLFLSKEEMKWALDQLASLPRPLVCLHPGGNTKSLPGSPWHKTNWEYLIKRFKNKIGFFQVGSIELGDYDLGLLNPGKHLRQMFALIWAADIFIGFDSSPMHIATAFRKPVIAIFDMRRKYEAEGTYSALHIPSVMLRWSYPFNRNIGIMENDNDNNSLDRVCHDLNQIILPLTYNF